MIKARKILSYMRRAVDDYGMIADGDKVAVGLSGGKDSLTLLCGLSLLRGFYPKKFDLIALTLDCGFENVDFTAMEKFCAELGVEYKIKKTDIKQVVFDYRKEKNPCSLCSKMRRGALNEFAISLGCNKIALGHHLDDSVETFMLNLFFENRIGSFSPVTYLDRCGITQIRPLIYAPEKEIKYFVKKSELPVIKSPCPMDKNTRREEVKKLIAELSRKYKNLNRGIFGAMQRAELDGYVNTRLPFIEDNE